MGLDAMIFVFLGSKITADGDCSHEIKRYLLLGRKVMTNLTAYLKIETVGVQPQWIQGNSKWGRSHCPRKKLI